MAKLIMNLDNSLIREVLLDKERITIGRKSHNDIQIDNLAVSGEQTMSRWQLKVRAGGRNDYAAFWC